MRAYRLATSQQFIHQCRHLGQHGTQTHVHRTTYTTQRPHMHERWTCCEQRSMFAIIGWGPLCAPDLHSAHIPKCVVLSWVFSSCFQQTYPRNIPSGYEHSAMLCGPKPTVLYYDCIYVLVLSRWLTGSMPANVCDKHTKQLRQFERRRKCWTLFIFGWSSKRPSSCTISSSTCYWLMFGYFICCILFLRMT